MDFAAPPAVLVALHRRIDQGCLGYSVPWPTLIEAVLGHLEREYNWRVEPEWLVWLPGLVTGLNVACHAIEGDAHLSTLSERTASVGTPARASRVATA